MRSAREALANFISPITLWLGNRGLSRSGSQTDRRQPDCQYMVGREALQLHFTDFTLTGNHRPASGCTVRGSVSKAFANFISPITL